MDRVYFWCVGGWPTDLVLALISSLLFLGTQNEQGDTDVLWLGIYFVFFFFTLNCGSSRLWVAGLGSFFYDESRTDRTWPS